MFSSNLLTQCICGAVVSLSFAIAGQAHALTALSIGAINGQDPGLGFGQQVVVSFDGPAPIAAGIKEKIGGTPGAVGLFKGTHPGVAAAPVGDTTQYQAISTGGTVTFNFKNYSPGVSSLSLYAGSIDAYNSFTLKTSKGTFNFDGSDFLSHNGDQSSSLTNRRVYFYFAPNEIFKSITLASSDIAFEYDSLAVESYRGAHAMPELMPEDGDVQGLFPSTASAAPEPAAWALMLTGFAFIGVGARGRRRALVV